MPSQAPGSLNPFQTLLRHRNFRLFWFGQTLSLIGTWMQAMSEGWLALELSNSAFIVGLVASAASFPILLISMHAGWFVDRSDKLRIVRIAQTCLGIQAALLWWFTWSGHITVTWLLVFALVSGFIGAFEIPARQSLVIELVGREDLPGAIALNSSGFNLARIVGPSIGAIIIAQFGIAWCFGVNALSYLTVLVGLFMVRLPAWAPPETLIAPIEGIREGFSYVRRTPVVGALLVVVAVFSVLGIPYLTMMPVIARDKLGMGAGGYGALLACVGVGGLTGALGLAALGDRIRRGKILTISSVSYAALLVAFSLVRHPALAYPILFCVGFAMIATNAVANATLQHLVPNELRGRMMAAYSLINVGLSSVLGSVIAGSVAHVIGVSWAVGGGGAILLVFSWWVYRNRPDLRAV